MIEHDVKCADCGKRMRLRDGKYRPFYSCVDFPYCRGSHGAQPDGTPLGIPGNAETKAARVRAHEALARVEGLLGKTGAYKWLTTVLHIERVDCHIARFDVAQCERTIGAVSSYFPEQRKPHKRQRHRRQK